MWARLLTGSESGVHKVIRVTTSVAVSLQLVLMVLITFDVIGRMAFGSPISGTVEVSEFMLGIVIFGSVAYAEMHRGHVTVDLVIDRLPRRVQTVLDSFAHFIVLIFLGILTWRLVLLANSLREAGLTSAVLELPGYPFRLVAAFGFLLFFFAVLINSVHRLKGKLK